MRAAPAGHRHTFHRPCPPSARSGAPCRPPGTATACSPERCSACSWSSCSPWSTRPTSRALDELDNDLGRRAAGVDLPAPGGASSSCCSSRSAFTTLPMTVYTAIAAGLLVWRKHGRAGAVDGRGDARRLADDVPAQGRAAAQAPGLAGPGHHADQLLLPVRARHRHRRRGRGGHRAGRSARTAPGPAPHAVHSSPCGSRCWSGWTGSSWACTTPPTWSPGFAVGAFWVLARTRGRTTRRRGPRPGRRSAPRCRPPGSSRWC